MTSDHPHTALGAFLTAYEAERLAALLEAGETTSASLKEVNTTRRSEATRLLRAAGLGHAHPETSSAVLRAIAGARAVRTAITPVWTMPGPHTTTGRLTGEVLRLIDAARMSVTCSSYNFTPRSRMWQALQAASARPQLAVTVYVDATAGTPERVADHLPHAAVYRTATLEGDARPLVSHAKFIVIDHAVVLTTSANFSGPAENSNIELGLLVHDTVLAETIETTMWSQHGRLYEQVRLSGSTQSG
jgi:phosphatidylserine/phosphatidylglycerophosphate/cardiolipin synthase-like enzyme